ncbi:helix-turn-helix domain-containing protein [Alkalihalobacterium sp. APHAB7]|uniref:helix-turn-helix domain-containing protein n=1 Tax=Alkalihalobacterium sp. APHAB7 TaxID=3402081 RepID=UPI003AB091CA
MSELGQRLREAREQKQINLDDLQKTTKIQKRYLLAIEEGNFDALPGKFYARAFVKNYAEAVGLDSEQIFQEFGNELPNPHKEGSELPSRRSARAQKTPTAPKKKSKGYSIFPALVAGLLIIVVFAGIWVFAQYNSQDSAEGVVPEEQDDRFEGEISEEIPTVPDEEEEEVATVEEETAADEEEVEEQTQVLSQTEVSGNHSYYTLDGTDTFEVKLLATGRSYVGIANAKGNSFFAAEVKDGDELDYDFSAEEEITFNLGASNNVQLLINGEPFELPLEAVHQKVTITFALANE